MNAGLRSIYWFLFLSVIFFQPLHAQISYTPVYHANAGNPGGLNNESDFATTGWTSILNGLLSANQWSNNVSIPFIFNYYGNAVTTVKVSANGLLTFEAGSSLLPNNNQALPTSALPGKTIACFWEEFTANPPTGSNDQVYTKTFGTFPNRQFWIRWSSFEWGAADFTYVAVVLEETTNKIYVVDMYGSPNTTSVTTTVGVQSNSSFAIQYGTVNTPMTAGGSVNSDNSYYSFTPFVIPPFDLLPVEVLSPVEEGCGLGNEVVSFRLTNIGQLNASSIKATFSIDGGTSVSPETIPGTLLPGDTLTYTFNTLANLSTPGNHLLKISVNLSGDGNIHNDTIAFAVNNLLKVASFPYFQNFENSAGGWAAGGSNSSWERGIPTNDTIGYAASGSYAWITNASGDYNVNENSFVSSPCFDLSNATSKTHVALKIWWESEFSWDGAVLQSSTDGGDTWTTLGDYGDPDNWYNDNSINGNPGGQLLGWTGRASTANGSDGWVRAQHKLPASLIGQPSVRMRLAFGSDGFQTDDGFAFDDFTIASIPSINLGPDRFFCDGDSLVAGNPGFSYLWSTGSTSPVIHLYNTAGFDFFDSTITVTVTDTLGMVAHDTIEISMAKSLMVSPILTTDILCGGDSTGSILVLVNGGSAPFTYVWNNGDSTQNLSDAPAGVYSLSVTDNHGCQRSLGPITLTENPALTLSEEIVSVSCYGLNDGKITISPGGGTGEYGFIWSNGGTDSVSAGLSAGSYAVTLTDAAGCELVRNYIISQPDSLFTGLANLTDASCIDLADGFIDLSISGGTPPFSYLWTNGDTIEDPEELLPGLYSATVSDSSGCFVLTDTFAITYKDTIPQAGFFFNITGGAVGFQDTSVGVLSWLWDFGDGKTSTLREPVHEYATNGTFTVIQIVSNLCGSDTMISEVTINTVGIDPILPATDWEVYPNPNSGEMNLRLHSGVTAEYRVQIFSPQGKLVMNKNLGWVSGEHQYEIKMPPGVAGGLYLLVLSSGVSHETRRILVR
ncbi:MAG: PKD domain-containing protein [Bacteroidia bacterium]|nr:PKD domain-containing protein [Bacteroidia bacterium]